MLMNSIILAISGCDTLRPLGTFANSARDMDTINGVKSSCNSPSFFFFGQELVALATILSTFGKFLVHAWSQCGGLNK